MRGQDQGIIDNTVCNCGTPLICQDAPSTPAVQRAFHPREVEESKLLTMGRFVWEGVTGCLCGGREKGGVGGVREGGGGCCDTLAEMQVRKLLLHTTDRIPDSHYSPLINSHYSLPHPHCSPPHSQYSPPHSH